MNAMIAAMSDYEHLLISAPSAAHRQGELLLR
jgi:hypothetical protein